jgi:hypothetical protein
MNLVFASVFFKAHEEQSAVFRCFSFFHQNVLDLLVLRANMVTSNSIVNHTCFFFLSPILNRKDEKKPCLSVFFTLKIQKVTQNCVKNKKPNQIQPWQVFLLTHMDNQTKRKY